VLLLSPSCGNLQVRKLYMGEKSPYRLREFTLVTGKIILNFSLHNCSMEG